MNKWVLTRTSCHVMSKRINDWSQALTYSHFLGARQSAPWFLSTEAEDSFSLAMMVCGQEQSHQVVCHRTFIICSFPYPQERKKTYTKRWGWVTWSCYDFIPCLPYSDIPHFFLLKPLMSSWHHYDIIPTYDIIITSLWPHFLPMTSSYSTTTSSPEHYKYTSIS